MATDVHPSTVIMAELALLARLIDTWGAGPRAKTRLLDEAG